MRIKGLDGLLAIAFFFVFAAHTGWLEFGWPAMQSFFVLSGFLITGILQQMKESLTLRPFLAKFYGRRFLRIFPVYYVYLLAAWLAVNWMLHSGYKLNYLSEVRSQFIYAATYTSTCTWPPAGSRWSTISSRICGPSPWRNSSTSSGLF